MPTKTNDGCWTFGAMKSSPGSRSSHVSTEFYVRGDRAVLTSDFEDGDTTVENMTRAEARVRWAYMVRNGAPLLGYGRKSDDTRFAMGPRDLYEADGYDGDASECVDPEGHDGEPCDCAERLAAERADHAQNFRAPPPGTFAYTAWTMAKSGLMTGEEADEWKDRMKDESMGVR